MFARFIRGLSVLGFTAAILSCSHDVTGPDGPGASDDFSLLIERRTAAGQRSFVTLGARSGAVAPFNGVPADARALIPSPDGKTIAYLREADSFVQLWAMDRDGANRRVLVGGDISVESASWSADGKTLALGYSTNSQFNDIAVVKADGTGFTDLTPDPLPGVWIDRDPSWSPDGTRIAFSSNRSGTQRIWIINADGTNPVFVTENNPSGQERQPVWSPDGTYLAFVATTAAGRGISFLRPDGSEYKHVPISPSPSEPAWLPDGRLAYVSNPSGDFDLFTLDRATGASIPLTSRRDSDVRASVLANVAPFEWLGFATPVVTSINRPTALDIDAADVITDGFDDLLVLSPILNEVRLMRGTATGAFQQVGSLFAEIDVAELHTGFVTADAAPDIIGRGDSAVYLWRGRADGPGISTRIPLNGEVRDAVLLDVDANGRAEIVSLVENGTQPFRLVTTTVNASDVVVPAANLATTQKNAGRMCAGDVNNDGRADLVILAGASSRAPLVAEGGPLALSAPTSAGATITNDLQAVPYCVDLNNDGRDDLVVVSLGQASGVSTSLAGANNFGPSTKIAVRPSAVVPVDIDRDGDIDLVVASSTTAELLVVKNRGDGRFNAPTSISLDNVPLQLTAGDFNGDAWPDVAIISSTGQLVVLLSRGRTGM
jgi:WD40 repeat protein